MHMIPVPMGFTVSYQCKEQSQGAILNSLACIQDGANSVACLVLDRTCHATCWFRAQAEKSQVWKNKKRKGLQAHPHYILILKAKEISED